MKLCKACGATKSTEDFYRSQRSKDGRQHYCKKCANAKRVAWAKANPERNAEWKRLGHQNLTPEQKANKRFARFRMNLDDYNRMLAQQGGVCASCGRPPGERRLQVDHDHSCCHARYTCGRCTRGLLCINCNAALGHVQDDKDRLMKLINYLDGG